jgi:alpha-L-rhamnosidase
MNLPRFPRLLLCALLSALTAKAADNSPAIPTYLRCEYLRNPLGIDVATPRLDWIFTGWGDLPRNLSQTSYHLLVASSPEILARDQGDLWDSGEVMSGDTTGIAYAGAALTSRETCFWKVRITDSLHRTSPWSQPATWEMGLLKPEDWHAKWLDAPPIASDTSPRLLSILSASYGAKDGTAARDVTALLASMVKDNALAVPVRNDIFGGDPAPLHPKQLRVSFTIGDAKQEIAVAEGTTLTIPDSDKSLGYLRKDFTLGKSIAKARLYATALGLYELHLNGRKVGDHVFAPDWTDYNKRVRYQVYDVTSMVQPGANTLAGLAGNGWYCGHIGNGGFQAWGTAPALFAQLEVTYADGTVDRFVTDASWKIHGSPILSSDFMLGENYDARREIAGWDQPGLDVAGWAGATERSEPPRPLDGQVDQAVRETGLMRPKSIKEPAPGHWTYDLGQNMVGFVRLQISAPAGTKITLRHAEMLNPDGTIYTKNLRGAPSIDTYICKGGPGLDVWQPHFTFHGFRYVELTGVPQPPPLDAVTGVVVGTDIPPTGKFSCSDPEINQLQSNIQWGMRGNYLSVPTDCPQRDERMGWMGDAQVFIRTATYNGDVAAFFTKWLVDVDDAQHPDGAFTDVSPSPKGRGHGNGSAPAWADAGVICPWTIYLMYGDKRILEKNLPAMKRWVDWCQAHSTNFIRDHDRGPDYGDWLSQGENTPKELIGTAYFAYSTSLVARACRAVGDAAGADKYQALFDQIKTAFNQRYVSPDGHIQGGTQCGYCMALRFNLLPEALRPKAGQYLAEDVASHNDHLTTGFVGVSYLLPALCSVNQTDTAYRVFLQDTFPSWLFSVKHGATTVWERWDGWTPEKGFQNPGMNSFNHYSLGSCGEWIFDSVAGIDPDPEHPGFKHIFIRPRPGGGFTQADGSFDSIHGKIVSKWSVENGTFSLRANIPINTTATIELPTADASSVREGGKNVAAIPDIQPVPGASGTARFLVGSGEYDFTCKVP